MWGERIWQSAATRQSFETAAARGDRFVASLLMEIEVRRVTKNAGIDQDIVSEYVDEFLLMSVSDELLAEAIALPTPLGGADSIHIASAGRLGPAVLTLDPRQSDGSRSTRTWIRRVRPGDRDPRRGPVVHSGDE